MRAIVSLSIGERYEPYIQRQIESVVAVGEKAQHRTFVNRMPEGAPQNCDLPWMAYCAKPFAMLDAYRAGYTTLLWLDAACYLVKPLDALWDHIEREGYYVQDNGWSVGQWCSDAALRTLDLSREDAIAMPEISTMALGLDLRQPACLEFLQRWSELAADGKTFMGEHTNDVGAAASMGIAYRAVGHVSDDPRVLGHRHDQTAASVLAARAGWKRTPRPIFASYRDVAAAGWGGLDDRTIIVNHGGMP